MVLKNKSLWLTLFAGGVILLPCLWFGWGADQSVHCYTAWSWLDSGKPPYIGGWHHNFPGIDLIYLLAFKLFGSSILGIRIMDFLIQLLTLGLLYYLAYTISGDHGHYSGVIASLLYAVYYLGGFYYSSIQKDTLAFPFLLLGLCFFLFFSKSGKGLGVFLVGLMVGCAFLMKPTFGLCGLVFSWLYFRQGRKAGFSWLKIVVEQIALAFFALLPFLIMLGLYWNMGAASELWDNLWVYNIEMYLAKTPNHSFLNWKAWDFLVFSILRSGQLIWLGFIIFLFFSRSRGGGHEERLTAGLGVWGLLLVCFISIFIQGKDFFYHQIPFQGFGSIFAGVGFGLLVKQLKEKISGISNLAVYSFISLIVFIHLSSVSAEVIQFSLHSCFRSLERAYLCLEQSANDYRAAEYVRARTEETDYVISWAGEPPNINFLAKRLSPSRFGTHIGASLLVTDKSNPHPLRLEWQMEFLDDLKRNKPVYFVIQEEASFEKILGGRPPLGTIPGLREFFDKNYILETQIGFLNIYRLVQESDR